MAYVTLGGRRQQGTVHVKNEIAKILKNTKNLIFNY